MICPCMIVRRRGRHVILRVLNHTAAVLSGKENQTFPRTQRVSALNLVVFHEAVVKTFYSEPQMSTSC